MLLERIKERAKQFGMSLSDVAEKTGISPNTVYSWRVKTPRADKLKLVADTLHTTTDYLTGSTDDPNIPIDNDENTNVRDLADDDTIFTYKGKPIPPEDLKIIRRLLNSNDE
ncbi:helix-turn-helix domain-containing protein [Lactobacillus hominis]|uniref:helix-turn-helix domain-containing protein n=1 Tax=Lactobacillus hominis TaxID=1203033 RepID=UPI0023F090AF|nr:helix-turn-helix transcriptional regulator [Lactobacillus hominis]